MRTSSSRIGLAVACLGLVAGASSGAEASTDVMGSKAIPRAATTDGPSHQKLSNPYAPGYYQTWRKEYSATKGNTQGVLSENSSASADAPVVLASAAKSVGKASSPSTATNPSAPKKKSLFSFLRRSKSEPESMAIEEPSSADELAEVAPASQPEARELNYSRMEPPPPNKIVPATVMSETDIVAEAEAQPVVQWAPNDRYRPQTVSMPPNAVISKKVDSSLHVPILPTSGEPGHFIEPTPANEPLRIAPPIPESVESKYRSSYSGWPTKTHAEEKTKSE